MKEPVPMPDVNKLVEKSARLYRYARGPQCQPYMGVAAAARNARWLLGVSGYTGLTWLLKVENEALRRHEITSAPACAHDNPPIGASPANDTEPQQLTPGHSQQPPAQ